MKSAFAEVLADKGKSSDLPTTGPRFTLKLGTVFIGVVLKVLDFGTDPDMSVRMLAAVTTLITMRFKNAMGVWLGC